MSTIAELAIKIDSTQAGAAANALDKMAISGGKAEIAAAKLAAAQARLSKVQADTAATAEQVSRAELAVAEASQRAAAAHARHTEALNMTGRMSGRTQAGLLNLSRQFTDVGVSAAMGMNPMMILVQQGPQIADALGEIKSGGLGVSAAFRQVAGSFAAALAPLAPFLIAAGAIAAVVGGSLLLGTREINKENEKLASTLGLTAEQMKKVEHQGVTMGDTLKATFQVLGGYIWDAIGPTMRRIGDVISDVLDAAGKAMKWAAGAWLGAWLGAFGAIRTVWGNLPSILGDVAFTAVNVVLKAVEIMVNRSIERINTLSTFANAASQKLGMGTPFGQIGTLSLGVNNPFAGGLRTAGGEAASAFGDGFADGFRLVDKTLSDIAAQAVKNAAARIREEAGKAKKETAKAVKEMGVPRGLMPEDFYKVQLSQYATNDNTYQAGPQVNLSGLRSQADDIGDIYRRMAREAEDAIRGVEGATNDMFHALRDNNWAGAALGLIGAIKAINAAKASGVPGAGTSAYIAAAGTAGSMIGGKAGSALMGAATGAQLGTMILPGIGTAIGAVVGGLAGLFGGGSAKKKEAEAARQKAVDDAERARQTELQRLATVAATQRQIEIDMVRVTTGDLAALAMEREDELEALKALDPALVAVKQSYFDAADAATKAAKAQDDLRVAQEAAAEINRTTYAQAIDRVAEAQQKANEVYAASLAVIDATRTKYQGLAEALRGAREGLFGGARTGADGFFGVAARAQLGDADAMGKLPGLAGPQAELVRATARNRLEEARGLAAIGSALQGAEDVASRQVSIADQQLDELKKAGQGWVSLNETTGTGLAALGMAINNLSAAFGLKAAAQPGAMGFYGAPQNVDVNKALEKATGYSGGFGSGGFQAYITSADPAYQAAARDILNTYGQGNRIQGFATGGEGVVGGSGGPDSKLVSMRLTPGELVSVRKGGQGNDNSDVVSELRALRVEAAATREKITSLEALFQNVTLGGVAMQTEAA